MSEEGFRRFAAVHLKDGKKPAELVPLARRLLEEARAARKGTRSVVSLTRRNNSSDEMTGFWAPAPEEFLVWEAWKNQRSTSIESEIMPLAAAALDKTRLDRLKAQIQMWTCSAEEFAARAKSYVSSQGNGPYENVGPLMWAIDRWAERDLPGTPLDELLSNSVSGQSWSTPYALIHYIQTRGRLRPTASAEEFVTGMLKKSLGAKMDSWKNQMDSAVNAYYGSGSFSASAGYSVLGLVNQLIRKPATIGLGLKIATLTGLSGNGQWSRQLSSALEQAARTPSGALTALEAAGLLLEADKLQLPEGTNSMPYRVLNSLGSVKSKASKIAEKLAAHQPQTFGVELAAVMCTDPVAPALTAFLKKRRADLAKVPESSRAGLASLIKSKIPGLSQGNSSDQDLIKAVQPLMAVELANSAAFVDKWLATTNTKTIEEDDDDYETKLVDTVRELIFTDPDKAKKLFIKGCELIENRVSASRWEGMSMWNGWTHRSEMLDRLKVASAKPEILGFYMKMVHEDTSGHLSCDGWAAASFGGALNELWRNNGGGGAMGRGIDAVLRRVSEVLGDTPATLMPLVFHDFVEKLPQAQRVNALRYAAKLPPTHPQAALGKELEHAARLFLANDPNLRNTPNVKNSLAELGGMEPAWAHFRARLKDTKLHNRLRHSLGHFVCYEAGVRVDPECARLAAAAALETMKAKQSIHGYQYGWIMHGFNQLPVDDAWKASAQEHWDAWIARCNNGGLSKYSPADWAINSILRMVARSGDEEHARSLLQTFHHTLSNEASGITSLVLGGMQKLAAEHFSSTWQSFFVNTQKELSWSQQLQEGLPAFRAACKDPATAYLGELYLSVMKDPPKPDQDDIPGFRNRDKRMKELAMKFKDIHFTDPEMRRDAVNLICMDWSAALVIPEVVNEIANSTDMAQMAGYTDTWEHWQQLKPLQISLGIQAANGEVKPAIALYDKALAATTSEEYYQKSLVVEIGFGPIAYTPFQWVEDFKAGRPSKTKELMPFLDHVLEKTPKSMYNTHISDAICLKWLIHLLHQDEAGFEKWRKALKPDDATRHYTNLDSRWQMWSILQRYCTPDNQVRLKVSDRLPLVTAVLKNEWTRQRYPATGAGIPNLINEIAQKVKVFKTDELAVVAAQMAEALPRMGRTAGEAADYLAAQGKPEPAVSLYALAFQHAQKENQRDYSLAAGYLLKQAETLERMNKKPEAIQILQSIEQARVGPVLKKQVELASKRLNTQPQPKK